MSLLTRGRSVPPLVSLSIRHQRKWSWGSELWCNSKADPSLLWTLPSYRFPSLTHNSSFVSLPGLRFFSQLSPTSCLFWNTLLNPLRAKPAHLLLIFKKLSMWHIHTFLTGWPLAMTMQWQYILVHGHTPQTKSTASFPTVTRPAQNQALIDCLRHHEDHQDLLRTCKIR